MKIEWKTCLKIGVSAFALYLCIRYWPQLSDFFVALLGAAIPLVVGAVMAYVVNILMRFYEKFFFPKAIKPAVVKTRRLVCMLGAYITVAAILSLVSSVVVIQLVECVKVIIDETPGFVEECVAWLQDKKILSDETVKFVNGIDWKSKIDSIVSLVTSGIGNIVGIAFKTISSVISGAITTLIAVIFSIYILWNKEKLVRQFNRLLKTYVPQKWYERITYVLTVLNESFSKFIVGQCTEAFILGGLCALGMLVLRIPYPSMIGVLVGFTALVPIAGAYIGAILGAFIIFTVSPGKALVFIIFIIILQQLEGNIIYPKVVGYSIGLPGIWVLAAVTIGGGLFGIIGMLVSVPLASALYRIVTERLRKDSKNQQPPDVPIET